MTVVISQVSVDPRQEGKTRRFVRDLTRHSQQAAERTYARVVPFTVALLSVPAPPPVYPIAWTSERQRKAFFATNGFGRGIPTRRTGRATTWTPLLEVEPEHVTVTISNDAWYLRYVRVVIPGRRNQIQRFHANRWTPVNPIAAQHQNQMRTVYLEELHAGYEKAAR